ncbi:MAG TPA: ABC transporter substrate-binding protein [Gammaproteobacteria bacterium]
MRPTTLATLLALLFTLFASAAQADAITCPRIVSQSPYITKSLQWLGLEACIVGVSRYDTLERPRTGGVLDPDAGIIAVLEPQLLFTSDWTPAATLAEVTPAQTRSYRLDGFGSMAQVEDNLRLIGHAAQLADTETRVAQFHQQWRAAAHAVHGDGQRVLLLSSCSGTPYSFGRERWLSDLFTEAGFINVESEAKIRHLRPGEEVATINALIEQLQPQLLFIFERTLHSQCAFIKPKTPLRIISLDGEKFLHPAPVVLEGLAELASKRNEWSRQ